MAQVKGRQQRLTEANLKKLENALPDDKNSNWLENELAKDLQKDQKVKSIWGDAPRFKNSEKDDRQLLYPKYDLSRPNLHGNKSVIKKPSKEFIAEKKKLLEQEAMEATTAATSVIDESERKTTRKGCTIAP